MSKRRLFTLATRLIVFLVVFCLTARPALNALDAEDVTARGPRSLAESLFRNASEFSRTLHERPFGERSQSDYLRALDAYGQVIRLNTDAYFTAESLVRRAELQREMADATGDGALYQQAIESFREVVRDYPHSAFVGDALISIAEIYKESLQDLDGAAGAYRELIAYFPDSVLAREARAVLARFEDQLRNRPVDVIASPHGGGLDAADGRARLTNVRNFSSSDYARAVIDLSGETDYTESRLGNNRIAIKLSGAAIAPSLYGRRFIVGDMGLLKRINVVETSGVQVELEVSALADYSTFRLPDPERIVIDIHPAGTLAKTRAPRETVPEEETTAPPAPEANVAGRGNDDLAAGIRKSDSWKAQKPILGLPEIHEPIQLLNSSESDKAGPEGAVTAAVESGNTTDAPIKCIVIDPGHGGHDTGTISSGGMREKDLVLDVARRLRAYIKRHYPDIQVILTRETDRFIALEERTAIANSRHADLFISIHANASPSSVASGVETFFVSPDRAKDSTPQPAASPADKPNPVTASITAGNRVAESREFARYIQSGLVRGIGAASPRTAANRGVKHAPFVVLMGAAMPSVLAEVSFLSNPRDEALLQTSQFRERIAASLFAGLRAYLKRKNERKGKTVAELQKEKAAEKSQ
ncbi:MAG TPA: N-acetylmuramoyl-L-alanine amidase [Blastocatellia bacterium]|nr:N-acetylmuramoyl-L-alanine amidase [Blastocatellia bacterium]